jgi:hypothetical protein
MAKSLQRLLAEFEARVRGPESSDIELSSGRWMPRPDVVNEMAGKVDVEAIEAEVAAE